jgi:hypothetical protein
MTDKQFILRGVLNEDQSMLAVWCPYCQTYHFHGWRIDSNKPEHRMAHCNDQSPLKGYYIAPIHSYREAAKKS